MFEVEQNFLLSSSDRTRLLDGALFSGEKTMTDVYYDAPEFPLTKKDWWLRSRNGRYELKIPAYASTDAGGAMDQYEEVENDADIQARLGFQEEGSPLAELLVARGFTPYCTCVTVRHTYTKQGFTIVFDTVSYPDTAWTFDACEIELLVAERAEMAEAVEKIKTFAKAHGLDQRPMHGKVIEYLFREKPELYHAFVQDWTLLLKPRGE